MERVRSQRLYEEAVKYIPYGSIFIDRGLSENKKFMKGEYPIYFKHGEGSHLISVDDEEFIDYNCAGLIILGYNYPSVMEKVEGVLKSGAFHMQSPLMIELAKELIETIPGAERVYFCKTGSDASTAAVKIAKSYTGKEKVVVCDQHYYGWHDWCRVGEKGVPKVLSEYTLVTEFNNLESLEQLFKEKGDEIACFIIEPYKPIIGELSSPAGYSALPREGYLEGVRKLTKKHNVVLIFDEVKVCFRLALGGAREYFGVIPDVSSYGKGMGNGFPMAAVLGSKEVMESADHDFMKTTIGEEAIGMAAALALINEEKTKNVIGTIFDRGRELTEGLDNLAKDQGINAKCSGLPPMFRFYFDAGKNKKEKRIEEIFFQECLRRGLYIGFRIFWFVYYTHTKEDIHKTLEICEDSLRIAKKNYNRQIETEFLY